MSLKIDENYYKKVVLDADPNTENINKALDIVKRYVIREKLIIVGGMAIDFALRLHRNALYDENTVPDYDFLTPHHWIDAYEIAQWLSRVGITDISVINAQHPTTMRVRIAGISVADVTYVPKVIYDRIPRLNYHGFDFIHPHSQYIDQHRSLSLPYENLDLDRPVYKNRWKKDIERFDLLWEEYPLKPTSGIKPSKSYFYSWEIWKNQCIGGFAALYYWCNFANKKGFTEKYSKFEVDTKNIEMAAPKQYLTIYSNNVDTLVGILKNKKAKITKFNRLLDKIPERYMVEADVVYELIDNKNNWIGAYNDGSFWVCNLQLVMMYMLTKYILLKDGDEWLNGYMMCHKLLEFGVKKNIKELLPTTNYYGDTNLCEAYIIGNMRLDQRKTGVSVPAQPRHIYDRDLKSKTIPTIYYEFKPATSEIFSIDGQKVE